MISVNPYFIAKMKHRTSKSSLTYVLSKLLNKENGCVNITSEVHTHSFYGYKKIVKKNNFKWLL